LIFFCYLLAQQQFRSLIFDVLGTFQEEKIVQYSKKAFALHYDNIINGNKQSPLILPDLRHPVYSIIASGGAEKEFDMLWEIHQRSDLSEEKRRCLQALGKFSQKHLLQRVLQLCLSPDVRHQDLSYPIGSVSSNPVGKMVAWEFFKDNWQFFDETFNRGGQNFVVGAVVSAVTSVFLSAEMADTLEAFFKEHPVPSAETGLRQSLENVRVNSNRLKRDRASVPDWLQSHV